MPHRLEKLTQRQKQSVCQKHTRLRTSVETGQRKRMSSVVHKVKAHSDKGTFVNDNETMHGGHEGVSVTCSPWRDRSPGGSLSVLVKLLCSLLQSFMASSSRFSRSSVGIHKQK